MKKQQLNNKLTNIYKKIKILKFKKIANTEQF